MFKLIVIILLLLIFAAVSGCTHTTLAELEEEALRTGDWSLVEKREARQAYDVAMEQAIDFCKNMSSGSYVLVCVNMPRSQKVRHIKDFCGCGPVADFQGWY